MEISTSKRACSHRFVDQYSSKCLHCDHEPPVSDDHGALELEHYERLVSLLDQWKQNMVNRIDSIHKSRCQRLRDEFERQQADRRRLLADGTKSQSEPNSQHIDLTNVRFQLVHSSGIDTEYNLMATSFETIFLHDGRVFKLFDKNLRPLLAFDLNQAARDHCKVIDLCYVPYLSSYLLLCEQGLWTYQSGTTASLVTCIRRRGYLSLTSNAKDLFLLDSDGTIEQRSLVSWIFLRRYSKQQLLNDNLSDHLLSIRFHCTDHTTCIAIVRTSNNRRCLLVYRHYGSNTMKLLDRILIPNTNIYSIAPMRVPHGWLLTTCEKQALFFVDNQHGETPACFQIDCEYRIKSVLAFGQQPRSLLVRTAKPSQLRLYHF